MSFSFRSPLYAIVDPLGRADLDPVELGERMLAGGARLLQLRWKDAATDDLVRAARELARRASARGATFLVNDRVDVALAAGADGVHVGQDDMPAAEARRLLGPSAVIGLSIKTMAEAEAAPLDVLDYVCLGGVFVTTSKDNTAAPIGIPGLKNLLATLRARARDFPIGAIAGIDETNAGEVVAAGADGVAVISALSLAPDPAGAARRLRGIVDQSLRARGAP